MADLHLGAPCRAQDVPGAASASSADRRSSGRPRSSPLSGSPASHRRTTGSELIFTVFAAIAKFQRQQIVKGTREGLDAARARGRFGGRPRALTSEQIADARILLSTGQTRTAVAAKLRVSRWTLSRALDTAPR